MTFSKHKSGRKGGHDSDPSAPETLSWWQRLQSGLVKRPKSVHRSPSRGEHDKSGLEDPMISSAAPSNHKDPNASVSAAPSLWYRAYDTLRGENPDLILAYEKILLEKMSVSVIVSPADSESGDRHTEKATVYEIRGADGRPTQNQLSSIIEEGVRQLKHEANKYTDNIQRALAIVDWAKDLITDAVQCSPAASIAWVGISILLPLLLEPQEAAKANSEGLAYVMARTRYYTEFEPILRQLETSTGVPLALMEQIDRDIVDLYQLILEFQIKSVLRFSKTSLGRYVSDIIASQSWENMRFKIEKLSITIDREIDQTNDSAIRITLESIRDASEGQHQSMKRLLNNSEAHLAISKKTYELQENEVSRKLSEKENRCLQLFRLTRETRDATYEWYKDRVEDRVEGTCQWVVEREDFQIWSEQQSGPLLISADPGCGKPRSEYSPPSSLRSLASTFPVKPCLIKHGIEQYDKDGQGLIKSTASLWAILEKAVGDPEAGPVIIVLDALDECDPGEFEDLLRRVRKQFLSECPGHRMLKYLLTSRPYEKVLREFDPLSATIPYLRIPGEAESDEISKEINLVIDYRVKTLAERLGLSDQVRSRLEEKLLSVEHRTYLWAYLVFDYLEEGNFKKTKKGVDAAFENLPKTIYQAYEQILGKSQEVPMVRKALSIILAASRPLSISEMNIALNIDQTVESSEDIDMETDDQFETHLRSWCGLFVSVHHGKVYFIHQTAREFLIPSQSATTLVASGGWQHSITLLEAHKTLTEICVVYLNLIKTTGIQTQVLVETFPFHSYVADSWSLHFLEADVKKHDSIVDMVMGICDPSSGILKCWYEHCLRNDPNQRRPPLTSSLMVSSFFELATVIEMLFEKSSHMKIDLELKDDEYQRTALLWATYMGHEAVVKLLLEKGSQIEAQDSKNCSPLQLACYRGHERIARALVEKGANVNSIGLGYSDWALAPLFSALSHSTSLAELLIEKGADLEYEHPIRDYEVEYLEEARRNTVLTSAASSGKLSIVRFLLEKGAEIEHKNTDYLLKPKETPLLAAVMSFRDGTEHLPTIQLLLEKGANIETAGEWDITPLIGAVQKELPTVVELLLNHGADIEGKDHGGQTPLFWAVHTTHDSSILNLLLDKGANIETKNEYGRTPLFQAVRRSDDPSHLKILLDKDANIEAKDQDGRTPLFRAAQKYSNPSHLKTLLDRGANIEAKPNDGITVLSRTAHNYHNQYNQTTLEFLLDNGADIESQDFEGRTPLMHAVTSTDSNIDIVKLLISRGANVNAADFKKNTVLELAIRRRKGYDYEAEKLESQVSEWTIRRREEIEALIDLLSKLVGVRYNAPWGCQSSKCT
ncbi:hypothetical protein F5Y16DRAFT_401470 [Xylariaceae sp. FL0255]|nr:hypothetical protein F5Y16DRAFT_401470 [Xylariaceae sp. FL0255]